MTTPKETCPKCGAKFKYNDGVALLYECGAKLFHAEGFSGSRLCSANIRIAELQSKVERLREYVDHKPDCHTRFNGTHPCNCDFDKLSALLEKKGTE
jgi:hypothetical protein